LRDTAELHSDQSALGLVTPLIEGFSSFSAASISSEKKSPVDSQVVACHTTGTESLLKDCTVNYACSKSEIRLTAPYGIL